MKIKESGCVEQIALVDLLQILDVYIMDVRVPEISGIPEKNMPKTPEFFYFHAVFGIKTPIS